MSTNRALLLGKNVDHTAPAVSSLGGRRLGELVGPSVPFSGIHTTDITAAGLVTSCDASRRVSVLPTHV